MTNTPRVYLAGPMRGLPYFNRDAFVVGASALRNMGYAVFSPLEKDIKEFTIEVTNSATGDQSEIDEKVPEFSLQNALTIDLAFIANEADMVIVLPGWENSRGAKAEVALAYALHKPVVPLEDARLILGDFPVVPGKYFIAWWESAPTIKTGEVRTASSTGGEKGVKPARYDLIPAKPLKELAELYGVGAHKYAERNWERGYEWNKSFGALMRHAWEFWDGHSYDDATPEDTQKHHLACVAFHAMALMEWETTHPEFDNRPATVARKLDEQGTDHGQER